MDFRGPTFAGLWGRDAAPEERITRLQLAAISSIFMDFRGFHKIPWTSTHFSGPEFVGVWGRDATPKETFGPKKP